MTWVLLVAKEGRHSVRGVYDVVIVVSRIQPSPDFPSTLRLFSHPRICATIRPLCKRAYLDLVRGPLEVWRKSDLWSEGVHMLVSGGLNRGSGTASYALSFKLTTPSCCRTGCSVTSCPTPSQLQSSAVWGQDGYQ